MCSYVCTCRLTFLHGSTAVPIYSNSIVHNVILMYVDVNYRTRCLHSLAITDMQKEELPVEFSVTYHYTFLEDFNE